ncbi:MAG: translation initiation factor [Flavobacteriaceae bacterium]|nr:translation initiation factor [Flavobacteriaceae bacterium]
MDLQDQLKNLFPDHQPEKTEDKPKKTALFWIQEAPLLCKYEKPKGKPVTVITGYNGANSDFKSLTKALKQLLHVGGGFKNEEIVIQGDFRDKIMSYLQEQGFTVKRVGG